MVSTTACEVWEDRSGVILEISMDKSKYMKEFRRVVGDREEYVAPPKGDRPIAVYYVVKEGDSLEEAKRIRDSMKIAIR